MLAMYARCISFKLLHGSKGTDSTLIRCYSDIQPVIMILKLEFTRHVSSYSTSVTGEVRWESYR